MVQLATQTTTFDEFISWLSESAEYRYELHDGVIIEMPKPRGKHSQLGAWITGQLFKESERLGLHYFMPIDCILKSVDGLSGYEPDVTVVDTHALGAESRWEQESILTLGGTIPLVVEVVSTNWQDDDLIKYSAYQDLGITEYWIVDYLGLGGRRFIGNPKQPTISICRLVDGEYDVQMFRDAEILQSGIFPELELTANQIFMLGKPIDILH
jgi:Uma2 family endonuclease